MDKSRLDDETVLVAFELPAAVAATSVNLVGEFNGWSPGEHPMVPLDDGRFRTELSLPAGQRWRFRYLLDGQRWENDWAADDYVPNGLGADDSVVDLTDANGIPLAAIIAAAQEVTSPDGTQQSASPDGTQQDASMDGTQQDASMDGTQQDASMDGTQQDASPDGTQQSAPKRRWWQFWGRRLTTA